MVLATKDVSRRQRRVVAVVEENGEGGRGRTLRGMVRAVEVGTTQGTELITRGQGGPDLGSGLVLPS